MDFKVTTKEQTEETLKICNLCSKSCHLKVPFSEEDFGRPLLLCQRRYGPPSLGTLEIYKYDDVYHLYLYRVA